MLDKPITILKGVGPAKFQVMKDELRISTIEDLLYFSPRKYIDRSKILKIIQLKKGDRATVFGTISKVTSVPARRKFLKVDITDGTDTLSGLFFGGISFFKKIFKPGMIVYFSGKIDVYRQKQVIHPEYDFFDEENYTDNLNTGRVIPVYPSTEKLKQSSITSRVLRKMIKEALELSKGLLVDNLNKEIIKNYGLLNLQQAIEFLHFPETISEADKSRERLAFNELFFIQYYLNIIKRYDSEINIREDENHYDKTYMEKFISSIPFKLTGDQSKAIEDIKNDLLKPYPMNRMLQGDVGSGKTMVALGASMVTLSQGLQVAIMAPTEVLARQHYSTFKEFIPEEFATRLLVGSISASEKKEIYEGLADGSINVIIGTHALIQSDVKFKQPGLIVIDEQHRFGVNQRAILREKAENSSLLVMSATPIPRSLTLTLYGDLDVSYLKEKPANRLPVKTMIFPESRSQGIYNSIEKYVNQGRQCYYVLPLIEESEKVDLKSAEEIYDKLKNNIFPHRKVGLLHGKMKAVEKSEIMDQFKSGNIDILVSTTVIEVGVDVPNANIMVIHHSERFGLSQLHQLRGRIGRGEHQSYCILLHPDKIGGDSMERLSTIEKNSDGFQVAEADLLQRGAGELIGQRQHGFGSDFEFANLTTDLDILLKARKEAMKEVSAIVEIERVFNMIKNRQVENSTFKGMRIKRILSILS